MALTARPASKTPAPDAAHNEAAALRIIEKGGSAAARDPGEGRGLQHPLKFPGDGKIWQRLEAQRHKSAVKLPRNTWILQAIHEKLEREGG